ncbi:MAG: hypothetical protein ACRD5H_13790 [Nitrososphaerales archaeon]
MPCKAQELIAMKRILIPSLSKKDIYQRIYEFFSLQGYKTEKRILDQELSIRIGRVPNPIYWVVGIVFLIPLLVIILNILGNLDTLNISGYVLPATTLCGFPALLGSIAWFIWAQEGKIYIALEESQEGIYLTADLKGSNAKKEFNHLVGSLVMLSVRKGS